MIVHQSNYHDALLVRAIDAKRISVHHFVPATRAVFSEEALQNIDLQSNTVNEETSSVADRPVGAENQPVLAERFPEELERRHVRR